MRRRVDGLNLGEVDKWALYLPRHFVELHSLRLISVMQRNLEGTFQYAFPNATLYEDGDLRFGNFECRECGLNFSSKENEFYTFDFEFCKIGAWWF